MLVLWFAASPALADSDTLGPVSVVTANCGETLSVNLMFFVCLSPKKCDYALGVNDFTPAPISYSLAVEAPPNYPIYVQGLHTSKGYQAFKIVQAPQAADGPKVKITLNCVRPGAAAAKKP